MRMFQTRLTQLLGIEYPIIQGGMQWISRAELVGAVSNSGGLGILSALTFASPAELAAEIRKTRSITDKPFGVNLTMLPTLHPVDIDSYIDVIVEEGVRIVETAGRSPEQYMERLKAGGIKVIHKCVAVRFARTAERIGCDVVSIDGYECAGHPGEEDVTSLILIPLAADAVKIPVVASGGFGDARGLVAALALGAEGINMGTRFMVTQEAPIHPRVKQWLIEASERDTMLILRSLRNSVRVLRNPVAENVAAMEKQGATVEEMAPLISGQGGKELLETGEGAGLQACGQVVGLIRDIPSVKEVIDRIIDEARDILERFHPLTVTSSQKC
ncbi:nitronate monooxygenase [Dehalococcoidia bacterium]|nr:nitronate monooxygenase [Dehalococcoidia bacterium]